jgi:Rieske Fe-S protein
VLITRRQLFVTGGVAGIAGVAAATLRFLWPLDAKPPQVTRVSSSDVPRFGDDPLPIRVDGANAYLVVVNHAGDVIALSRKCTNEGCTVVWIPYRGHGLGRTFERVFRCACCGSEYRQYGLNHWGPAPRPLRHLPVERHSDGDVFVSLPGIANQDRVTGPP